MVVVRPAPSLGVKHDFHLATSSTLARQKEATLEHVIQLEEHLELSYQDIYIYRYIYICMYVYLSYLAKTCASDFVRALALSVVFGALVKHLHISREKVHMLATLSICLVLRSRRGRMSRTWRIVTSARASQVDPECQARPW